MFRVKKNPCFHVGIGLTDIDVFRPMYAAVLKVGEMGLIVKVSEKKSLVPRFIISYCGCGSGGKCEV